MRILENQQPSRTLVKIVLDYAKGSAPSPIVKVVNEWVRRLQSNVIVKVVNDTTTILEGDFRSATSYVAVIDDGLAPIFEDIKPDAPVQIIKVVNEGISVTEFTRAKRPSTIIGGGGRVSLLLDLEV